MLKNISTVNSPNYWESNSNFYEATPQLVQPWRYRCNKISKC